MATKRSRDTYVNRALATVNMTAANVETFEQIRFAVGLYQGVAVLIHKIEYHPTIATCRELVGAADHLAVGLTNTDQLTSLNPVDPRVLGAISITCIAANVEPIRPPIILDFTDLPQGGIIIPANPLYLGMDTAGFANPGSCSIIIYFTFKQLSDAEYVELLQTVFQANI